MKSLLILLVVVLAECFALPRLSKERAVIKESSQDDSIPVAYLPGNDCDSCGLLIDGTVGMFRLDTKQWCFGQSTKFNISEHATAYLGGNGYIISGFGTLTGGPVAVANYLKAVHIYNPMNNSYSLAPEVQIGRQQLSSVVVSDKIYINGGYTKSMDDGNTTEIFDGQAWSFGPQTIDPRAGHVLVSAGNYLWAIAGVYAHSPYNYLKSTEYLNLNALNDGWKQGPSMNNARGFLGAVIINNVIYACGGWNIGNNYANCETLVLNSDGGPVANQNWSVSSSAMQQAREDYTLVAYNNKAYTIGGYWPNTKTQAATTVEEYDPASDTWSVVYQAPSTGPFPNNCLGCRATLIYVSESDMTC